MTYLQMKTNENV